MEFNIGNLFVKTRATDRETALKFILPVGNIYMIMFKFGVNRDVQYAPINANLMVYNRENKEAREEALLA